MDSSFYNQPQLAPVPQSEGGVAHWLELVMVTNYCMFKPCKKWAMQLSKAISYGLLEGSFKLLSNEVWAKRLIRIY